VCSPTRFALITGRYQYRFPAGLEEPLTRAGRRDCRSAPTLPSLLRDAGYATALVGKWHLGELPKYGPLQSGYQQFWGFRGGGVDYFTHATRGRQRDLWDGDVPKVETAGYLTTLLGDRAIDVLERFARGAPFLLSLHFSAPHWPWEGPGDRAEPNGSRVAAIRWRSSTTTADRCHLCRDGHEHGPADRPRARRAREARAGADDTMVVFTSDNGGERFSDTWPFSGRSWSCWRAASACRRSCAGPGRLRPGRAAFAFLARELADHLLVVRTFDAGAQKGELSHRLGLRGRVEVAAQDEVLQARDLREVLDLGRHEAGVLENPIGRAQILRDQGIGVELERRALAGKVVELAARNGRLDFALGEQLEEMHALF
jgi:hypothetical protein